MSQLIQNESETMFVCFLNHMVFSNCTKNEMTEIELEFLYPKPLTLEDFSVNARKKEPSVLM